MSVFWSGLAGPRDAQDQGQENCYAERHGHSWFQRRSRLHRAAKDCLDCESFTYERAK
jgi:hypothetical protein